MFINRDNYETIFLLYVDNELTAEERFVVEEFVDANEDLREELDVLQSTVLPAENPLFVPKTQLYRNATPVESVQESLLLMLDNELADEYKFGLLNQIKANVEIRDEWSLLQKTVLDKTDQQIFDDKKFLYRHTPRVISMKVWRVAAAIVIGLGLFTSIILYNNNKDSVGAFVQTSPVIKTADKPSGDIRKKPLVKEREGMAVNEEPMQPKLNTAKPIEEPAQPVQQFANNKSVKFKSEIRQHNSTLPDRQTNMVKQEEIIEKRTIRPANDNGEMAVAESPVKEEITNSVIQDSDIGKVRNTFARLAVAEEDSDRFLNIEEDKVTRTKLGGIIRQVKRVVERNTKIKTSNGFRIGGFEIAIK